MTDQTAARDAMSSHLGARALRSASIQMLEGVATGSLPFGVRSTVANWLETLATGVERRADAPGVRDAARQAAGQTTQADRDRAYAEAYHQPPRFPGDSAAMRAAAITAAGQQPDACTCGKPEAPGVLHRPDKPCYLDEATERTRAQLATPCAYCGHTNNWHTLQGGCQVTAGEAGCGCRTFVAPAVGQQPTQQPATEAHAPEHTWAAELYDPLADEWVPGTRYISRERAVNHLAHARAVGPTWKDGTPTRRRLVRATTTYTVEDET